jgi:hypothetical protein
MTIESRVSLNDEIHSYICRYAKKDKQNVALMTMKTFVISVAEVNGEPTFGVNTQSDTCSLDIMMKYVDWLRSAYVSELDKFRRGVYFNGPEKNNQG